MSRVNRILSAIIVGLSLIGVYFSLDGHNPDAAAWAGICALGAFGDLIRRDA